MIPLLLTIRVHWFRLWVPLFIVWLLLLPVIVLLLPVAALACMIVHVNVRRAFRVFWDLLCGLSGTRIDVDDGEHVVAIRIY